MGHRRRLFAVFGGYSHELYCTSLAVVGPCYSPRAKPRTRSAVAGRLRAWQKRQDMREQKEQVAG